MKYKYFAIIFILLLFICFEFCDKLPFNNTDTEIKNFEKQQGIGFALYPFGGIGGIGGIGYTIQGEIKGKLRIQEGMGNDYNLSGKIDTSITRDWFSNKFGMILTPIDSVKGHLKIHVNF